MKKYKINISSEPHSNDLESIGSIFVPLIKNALSAEDLVGVEVLLNWRDIVGKEIFAFCSPLKTKFDPKNTIRTLYIEVPTGGFALEIQHKENYILSKINSYFGYNAVHKLNISQNANMKIRDFSAQENAHQDFNLTEEDEQYLQDITTEIKDENLKKILIKIGKNVIKSTKE